MALSDGDIIILQGSQRRSIWSANRHCHEVRQF
jgi:hypothetical protein